MEKREPQFYSVADLAAILGVHNSTIREQAAAGHLPAIRVGRLWRFPKKKIDTWLEKELSPAPTADAGEAEAADALDAETRAWIDADLARPLPPYEWGPEGPPPVKPVRYVPGRGFVVEGGKS